MSAETVAPKNPWAKKSRPPAFWNGNTPVGATLDITLDGPGEEVQAMTYVPKGSDKRPEPKTFSDGNPIMDMVITGTDVLTGQRGTLRMKQWSKDPLFSALLVAFSAAGEGILPEQGGRLQVKLVSGSPSSTPDGIKFLQNKVIAAKYTPPAATKANPWAPTIVPEQASAPAVEVDDDPFGD